MNTSTNILIVEDSAALQSLYAAYLEDSDFELYQATDLATANSLLRHQKVDLVLLDIELPDGNGMSMLNAATTDQPPLYIVMTGHEDQNYALEATQRGAVDFLSKPFDAPRLRVTLENAEQLLHLHQKVKNLAVLERKGYGDFIGASLAMQAVYRTIDSLAASDVTGFIVGESGTGKELAAEAIHNRSHRVEANFVAINCAAIPAELMESELFGHVKGAFTGANAARSGAASTADGGTLFLDEICEMSLDLQKKLLRFIQTGTFRKVGSDTLEKVDVRFVCATNKDPIKEVNGGRFREDLFYRLHVVPLRMPPLRERQEDAVRLADYFLQRFAEKEGKTFQELSASTREVVLRYPWPGNIRQLENAIKHAVVLHEGPKLEPEMLPAEIISGQLIVQPRDLPDSRSPAPILENADMTRDQIRPLRVAEREIIESAIDACDGNVAQAAGLLQISPSTIYRKMDGWQESNA